MMKTSIKQLVTPMLVAGMIVGGATAVSAMSDTDFKNAIFQEIQSEGIFSDVELEEIHGELEDISKEDILSSLQNELEALTNDVLQKEIQNKYKNLQDISDGEEFFSTLDEIYRSLDTYYMENPDASYFGLGEDGVIVDEGVMIFGGEFDFESEREWIIEGLTQEAKYIQDTDLENQILEAVESLQSEKDEERFFKILDEIYEKIDIHYGIDWDDEKAFVTGEFSFDEIREDILIGVAEEREYINDDNLKSKFNTVLKLLKDEKDEERFFEILDELYMDSELMGYYEEQGVFIISGDDFFGGEFDFESEREWIIEGLTQEAKYIQDTDLENQILEAVESLQSEKDEERFFKILDEIYEKIDIHYGIDWDDIEVFSEEDFKKLDDEDIEWFHTDK